MNRATCTLYPTGAARAESVVLVPLTLFLELQDSVPEEAIPLSMRCRTEVCPNLVGPDGFDGYCASCADLIDAQPCECGGDPFSCAECPHAAHYPGGAL